MSFLIETHQLSFSFGNREILHGIDLRVPTGSIYGFLGANGAGKSTTIRILLRLLRQQHGTVNMFGEDPDRSGISMYRKIGALIENPSLYPHLSGRKNLEIAQLYQNAEASRIPYVLHLTDLNNDADRAVREYSLGMKQRLGLAIALLHNPELLILDEPTNGLDPDGIADIRNLLIRLSREEGKTIFLSSHLLSEVERTADWVGILKQGKLTIQESMQALRKKDAGQIRISTSENVRAAQILREHGYDASLQMDEIYLRADSDVEAAAVNALLVTHHIPVFSLIRGKSSLETLYFNSTTDAH